MPPPPRSTRLPPALTPSAVAARSAFFCELCQKGYSRMNEFEAHEMSYDHQHKKRLKEMKGLQRSMEGTGKEDREKGPLISVKLGGSGNGKKDGKTGGGFKKGGFKNAFTPVVGEEEGGGAGGRGEERGTSDKVEVKRADEAVVDDPGIDSDTTDQDDYYDPSKPTGCQPDCPGIAGK